MGLGELKAQQPVKGSATVPWSLTLTMTVREEGQEPQPGGDPAPGKKPPESPERNSPSPTLNSAQGDSVPTSGPPDL